MERHVPQLRSMTSELVQGAVVEWAREAFADDVQTGFARARTFDGMLSQIVIGALERFSRHELSILARVLPLVPRADGLGDVAEFRRHRSR